MCVFGIFVSLLHLADNLMIFLNWRQRPDQLRECLQGLMVVSGYEVVKVGLGLGGQLHSTFCIKIAVLVRSAYVSHFTVNIREHFVSLLCPIVATVPAVPPGHPRCSLFNFE